MATLCHAVQNPKVQFLQDSRKVLEIPSARDTKPYMYKSIIVMIPEK